MRNKYIPLFLVFSFFQKIPAAYSSLGQMESSIEIDRKTFSAVRHTFTSKKLYTIHEIANTGISIREFASGGTIFAVSWTGVRHPELRNLLGKYFQDYQSTLQRVAKLRGGRSVERVKGQNVIVEKYGHMRWIQGRAYVPGLMPHGVGESEIQ